MEELKNEENEVVEITADTEIEKEEEIIDESKMLRRYMLTINNPEETDEQMFSYIEDKVPDIIKYCIFQREIGEETGTQHFQMFIQLKSPMRFRTFKKMFPRAHIEKAITNLEAREYCRKEDTRVSGPYEIGVFAEERGNSHYVDFYKAIEMGNDDEELRRLFPTLYPKMEKTIDKIRQDNLRKLYSNKVKEMTNVYIYGKAGVGKTFLLFKHYGDKAFMLTEYSKHPFDDYKNQDVVIFDDYRSQFEFSYVLRLLDIYPINLPRRFNNVYGNYNTVFITTNNNLNTQYSYQRLNDIESWRGFERRIHFVLNFESRERIVVEKASKPIEELEKVLPPDMFKILDFKYVQSSMEKYEKQIRFFEVKPEEDLPF